MKRTVREQELSLGRQLAIAVLNGDHAASLALADMLQEEHLSTQESRARDQAAVRTSGYSVDGYTVYQWPEFRDFARRLGVMWDMRTIDLTIHIAEGECVKITQRYAGADVPSEVTVNLREGRSHDGKRSPGKDDLPGHEAAG